MHLLLLSVVLLGVANAAPRHTCEECILMVAELQAQMATHDFEIRDFLHEHFCEQEGLDRPECRDIAGHYPQMLAVVAAEFVDPLGICSHQGSCFKSYKEVMLKEVSCEDCYQLMQLIHNVLVNSNDVDQMVELLLGPKYCEDPFGSIPLDCDYAVKTYFKEMHDEVVRRFFHPYQYCVYIGNCEGPTISTPVVTETTPEWTTTVIIETTTPAEGTTTVIMTTP